MPTVLTEEQIRDIQLATLRTQVDDCDRQIVEYLQRRMRLTDIIQRQKQEWGRPPHDAGREASVLSRVPKRLHGIYATIFAVSKEATGWTGI